jgi:outer membrane protein assembly factor BamB
MTYLGETDRAPSATETLAAEPALIWTAKAGKAPAGAIAMGDSVVAVQSTDKHLYVFLRGSGRRLWRKRLDDPGAAGPLLAGEWIYTASGGDKGRVYAYRLDDGKREWERRIGPVTDPIAAQGALVFAATRGGGVYALSTSTGSIAWRVALEGAVSSGVTPAGEHLIVATDDTLYLLERDTGKIAARVGVGGVPGVPAVAGDLLVIASPDGFVEGRNTRTLARLWSVDVEEPVFGSPAIARDTVFVATLSGKLWRIPLGDTRSALIQRLGVPVRAPPAPVAGGVLIATIGGEVLRITGDEITWRVAERGPIEYPPIVDQGTLFLVDGVGRIHVWQ